EFRRVLFRSCTGTHTHTHTHTFSPLCLGVRMSVLDYVSAKDATSKLFLTSHYSLNLCVCVWFVSVFVSVLNVAMFSVSICLFFCLSLSFSVCSSCVCVSLVFFVLVCLGCRAPVPWVPNE